MQRLAPHSPAPRAPRDLSARDFLPDRLTLPALRAAARNSRGCALHARATQTVFGAARAEVLVGEPPDNDEDLTGQPFVGPAGPLLDRALDAAGIARSDTYVTNVVKHFKWRQRRGQRLHRKPSAREIGACLPWLQKEIEPLAPGGVVCLGASGPQALPGKNFRVTVDRGRPLRSALAGRVVATLHPASIPRQAIPRRIDGGKRAD